MRLKIRFVGGLWTRQTQTDCFSHSLSIRAFLVTPPPPPPRLVIHFDDDVNAAAAGVVHTFASPCVLRSEQVTS